MSHRKGYIDAALVTVFWIAFAYFSNTVACLFLGGFIFVVVLCLDILLEKRNGNARP